MGSVTTTVAAAYMVLGTSINPTHRGMDAIEYLTMKECLTAQKKMLDDTKNHTSAYTTMPYCTNRKPAWWR